MKSLSIRHLAPADLAGNTARMLARVAINRGCKTVAEVRDFLSDRPEIKNPLGEANPMSEEVLRAQHRIQSAISNDERITVFGDYDVDGATALVQMVDFLKAAGATKLNWFIPHRLRDDYGLTMEAAERCLLEQKPELVIAVDCGSNSSDVVEYLRSQGCDLIVIDHHSIHRESKPLAHLNPNAFGESGSELRNLSAAGIVYVFTDAISGLLGSRLPQWNRTRAQILAGLGTYVDVMPLVGLNRVLTKTAITLLNHPASRRITPGLAALLQGSNGKNVDSWTLGFHLGPILNASGRIDDAIRSVNLLLASATGSAEQLAETCLSFNEERKEIQRRIQVEAIIDADHQIARNPDTKIIVVGRPHWHTGIVGIVASRLREKYNRPAIVCGLHEDPESSTMPYWKGSGRGVSPYHLGKAITDAVKTGYAIDGGGHQMAAGVRIAADKFESFHGYLNLHCSYPLSAFASSLEVLPASPHMLERDWTDFYRALEPFGAGNPRPYVILDRVQIERPIRWLRKKIEKPTDAGPRYDPPFGVEMKLMSAAGPSLAATWFNTCEVDEMLKSSIFRVVLNLRRQTLPSYLNASVFNDSPVVYRWVIEGIEPAE